MANSNVGWVSDSVTHADVWFRTSTKPTSTYFHTLSWQNTGSYLVEELDPKAVQALFAVPLLSFMNNPG
ncbi:hypothetical protein C8255_21660 [filamentous cyanobacterium CCP3]|nr:hypothetical protein C8255_21660 [filamentous cyanobacterium CCP3]